MVVYTGTNLASSAGGLPDGGATLEVIAPSGRPPSGYVYHSQIVPMFSIDSVCLPLHEGVCLLLFVAEVQAYAACSHETYSSLSVCCRSASAGVYHSQTVPIVQRKVLVLRLHINLTG